MKSLNPIIKEILNKFKESFLSIIPIILIVSLLFGIQYILLSNNIIKEEVLSIDIYLVFLVCALLIAIGITIFTHGAEMSMSKIGKYIGEDLTKRKSIVLIVIFIILLGTIITIAEPDLTVLANYIPKEELNPWLFRIFVGLGVGVFLAIGIIRILLNKSIKYRIVLFYGIIFMIASLFGDGSSEQTFLELSFDSGGVTTGPITVPFLIAFGVGIAGARGGDKSNDNSFGLTGLCSIGPILVVLILGLIIKPESLNPATNDELTLAASLLNSLKEVGIALIPITCIFLIYNFIFLKLHKSEFIRIIIGMIYTYIGLVIFLSLANYSFIPTAKRIGQGFGEIYGLIFVSAFLIGAVSVIADPSVQILLHQVEEITNGVIKKRVLLTALAIGVGLALLIASLRAIYFPELPILYILVPGYIICFILTFFSDDLFVALAFDSGGVASGAMSSAFILPFMFGLSSTIEGGTNGFGVIGILAMMPIITVQTVGVLSNAKHNITTKRARNKNKDEYDMQLIEF